LSLTTVSVVILNFLFRIGITTRKTLILKPSVASEQAVYEFMDTCGREWGARPVIIARATRIITELFEACVMAQLAKGDINVDVKFDEFNLDIIISYDGRALDLSAETPDIEEILDDEAALPRLSAEIIRRTVDRMKCEQKQGKTIMHIHLDH
jgi:xanthine permease XanP